jgi:23S rRNA (cytosine1962-C5)-methyltransferase
MENVTLLPGKEKKFIYSRAWIFKVDISRAPDAKPGDIVTVFDSRDRYVGSGFFNPDSKIAVRLITNRKDLLDEGFFRGRIQESVGRRKHILEGSDCCRLINAEGDLIPGLIVDKYQDYLSVQILSAGIESRRKQFIGMLADIIKPKGIIDRSDPVYRAREGLPESQGVCFGEVPEMITVNENGIKYQVDLHGGQKTGFFLDQKENRLAVRKYAKGKSVLDVFCNTGGFMLNALHAGAVSAVGIDSSEKSIEIAKENVKDNGFSGKASFEIGNAFNLLRKYSNEKKRYGLIVLDPPAFAKGRENLEGAFAGYKEINLRALKMLEPGGVLLSCSCSHHMTKIDFWNIMQDAAADARKRLRLLEYRTQAPDHPILSGMPETEYLKCVITEAI